MIAGRIRRRSARGRNGEDVDSDNERECVWRYPNVANVGRDDGEPGVVQLRGERQGVRVTVYGLD
jgi:hypothetical protein